MKNHTILAQVTRSNGKEMFLTMSSAGSFRVFSREAYRPKTTIALCSAKNFDELPAYAQNAFSNVA